MSALFYHVNYGTDRLFTLLPHLLCKKVKLYQLE